jgi:hypothetical protein
MTTAFPIAFDPLFEPAVPANMAAGRYDADAALANIEAGRAPVAVAAVAMVVIRLGAGGTDAKAREQKRGGGDDEMLHLIFPHCFMAMMAENAILAVLVPQNDKPILRVADALLVPA